VRLEHRVHGLEPFSGFLRIQIVESGSFRHV
jgi:hypothetical protein